MCQGRLMIAFSLLMAGTAFAVVVNLPLAAQVPRKPDEQANQLVEEVEAARRKIRQQLLPLGEGLPQPYLKCLREINVDSLDRPALDAKERTEMDRPADVAARLFDKIDKFVSTNPVVTAQLHDDLHKLLALRYVAAVQVLKAELANFREGRVTDDKVVATLPAIRDALVELHDNPADQIPILELCVETAAFRVGEEAAEYNVGRGTLRDLATALHDHLGARITLLRAREKRAKK